MTKQVFTGTHPLPFSDLIIQNGTAYVAGQVGFDADSKLADNIQEQTKQTLENLKKLLEKGGYSLADVVRVGVYLTDRDNFTEFNKVYSEYFETDKPVRTTIFTVLARDDFLVEMDAVAVK